MTARRFVPTALSLLAICSFAAVPALAASAPAATAPPATQQAALVAPAPVAAPAADIAGPVELGSKLEPQPLFPDDVQLTPAPQPMAPECHFCSSTLTTSPGGGAASHWGMGATCTDAQNDVRNQLSAFVNDECATLGEAGRCAFAVVYTASCYETGGQWKVDAYATYRCWVYYC